MEGVDAEGAREMKLLGVMIGDRTTWKPHIKRISTKVSRSMSVAAKAKHIKSNI